MEQIKKKTAFVFTGGGSLGAVQVGMLRAVVASGESADFVVGCSVGAINACYFAACPDLECVARLEEIWRNVRRADIFPLTLAIPLGFLFHPDYIVSPNGLRRLIERHLPYDHLEDAIIPVHVMATDQQGMSIRLSGGCALNAILASTAMPGVFPTVDIGGLSLMDGAVAANTPISAAIELGATRIIVFTTGYACAMTTPPAGVVATALHAITLMINWQLMHELERIPENVSVHVAPTLCPLSISPFDFSATQELIVRGEKSTRRWIDGGGLLRQSRPSDLSAHRH